MKLLARILAPRRTQGANTTRPTPFGPARWWAFVFLFTSALGLNAATWYVDADRPSNGDGRSWGSAWKELTNVVWTAVSPGDTVWISGGTYSGRVLIERNGTAAAPISIRAAREAGHNNPVILNGRISIGNAQYITFDGSKSDTHSITNAASTTNLVSNINWFIRQGELNTSAFMVFGNSVGLKIKWIDIDGMDSSAAGNSGIGFAGSDHALNEIAYCHIHHLGQDGIGSNNETRLVTDFDIHHCYIHDVGDDGIEMTGGVTIRENRVQRTTGRNGHPDCIVIVDDQAEISGNILGGFNTVPGVFLGLRRAVQSHIWVWNNLIYRQHTNSNDGAIMITVDQTLKEVAPQTWSDIKIFNNTIVGIDPGISFFNRYRPGNTTALGSGFNVIVRDSMVVNNLILDAVATGLSLKGWESSGILFSPSDLIVSNNVISSSVGNGRRIYYRNDGNPYATAELFNTASGFAGNTSQRPSFARGVEEDYRLASRDTVAQSAGANLASLGITTDIQGTLRSSSSAWDIGAFAGGLSGTPTAPTGLRLVSAAVEPPSSADLLVHLDFEDDFSDGRISDASGGGRDMVRMGFSATPTNWPSRVPGRVGSFGANFGHNPNALYPAGNTAGFHVGEYGAITNLTGLRSMTRATIAFWGYYNTSVSNSPTLDHNGTFLDAGYAKKGAWHFGRYYSTTYGNTRFMIATNDGAGIAASARLTWPEDYNASIGNSGGWKHYAVTVDCSSGNAVVKGYLNGVEFGSMTVPGVSSLQVADVPGTGPTGFEWIAVGSWTHNGTATLDDGDLLPNNGWLNGGLDDIRIYGRVLSPAEINSLTLSASAAMTVASP